MGTRDFVLLIPNENPTQRRRAAEPSKIRIFFWLCSAVLRFCAECLAPGAERRLGGDFGHIGIRPLHCVDALLDFAHGVYVFHQAAFATVTHDQTLHAGQDRNLRSFRTQIFDVVGLGKLHVEEGTQALVLAKIATRLFVAVAAVGDLLNRFGANEGRAAAVRP